MRKFQTTLLALAALFALSAVCAGLASAETTLLAEWLLNGVAVATLTSITSMKGLILLEDSKLGVGVECEGEFEGSVGPNGEDETTEVLNNAGEKVTEANPLTFANGCKSSKGCEEAGGAKVVPLDLPWHTLLFLMENGVYLDSVALAAYLVECRILLIKDDDTCTVENGAFETTTAVGGSEALGPVLPDANCSLGGAGVGIEEFLEPFGKLLDLEELAVVPSSE